MSFKLGFHYHVPASVQEGKLSTPGFQGCFLDALAEHFTELVCFLHRPPISARGDFDYTLRSSKVRLVSLPPHDTVPRRLLQASAIRAVFAQAVPQVDALLLRAPTPLLPILAGLRRSIPTPLLVVGDARACLADSPKSALRRLLMHAFWSWNAKAQLRLSGSNLVLVNSPALAREMSKTSKALFEIRTSTITAGDIASGPMEAPSDGSILYVGRMTMGKGILDILAATALLRKRGHAATLRLIGWEEPGDSFLSLLRTRSAELGIARHVSYLGPIYCRPRLFAEYKRAAVFVTASRTSEGIPRTVWEAMACGTPVVATSVGGIPEAVNGAALLCPPRSPEGLADSIARVLQSSHLRMQLIQNGFLLAREVTLEAQARKIADLIKCHCKPAMT